MSSGRKSRAWWSRLSPAKRTEMKRRQAGGKTWLPHHYCDDLARSACGTDSTVGCIAEVVGGG